MADSLTAINNLRDSVIAIEKELGVNPKKVYSTVRARLDILENRINNPTTPTPSAENPFSIGTSGVTIEAGEDEPTTLAFPGSLYLRYGGTINEKIYVTDGVSWQLVNNSSVSDATNLIKGIIQLTNDLGGTATSPSVVGLQGRSVKNQAPNNGEVLTWDSVNSEWIPSPTAGSVPDADSSTKGIIQLTADLSGTAASPKVVAIQNRNVKDQAPNNGELLIWNSLNSEWTPGVVQDADASTKGLIQLSLDISGTADSPLVSGILGFPILGEVYNGYGICFNEPDNEWNNVFIDGYSNLALFSGVETIIGSGSESYNSIGVLQINADEYGQSPTFIFEAIFQATSGEIAEVRLYNLTDGAPVSGSLLSTSSNIFEYNSAILTLSGNKLYEAQCRITNPTPGVSDGIICGNINIRVKLRNF